MWTVFRQSLERGWGQVLGWGLSLGVLGGYLVKFYDTIAAQQAAYEQLLRSFPQELFAFFGDMDALFTPDGFLHVEFFSYMPLILGIHAILAGSGLLAADEESGVLDLVLAHPVSRWRLFLGRVGGFLMVMGGILGLCWVSMLIGQRGTSLDMSAAVMLRPYVSLAAQLLFFAALALLLSMVLPSRRSAGMAAGLALVGSFFLVALGRIDDRLADAAQLSPMYYYQGGEALNGLNAGWTIGLLALAVVMAGVAGWRFARRDIRVAGEGSFGLFSKRLSKA
jgi:ABC-2 type transport system permease protein